MKNSDHSPESAICKNCGTQYHKVIGSMQCPECEGVLVSYRDEDRWKETSEKAQEETKDDNDITIHSFTNTKAAEKNLLDLLKAYHHYKYMTGNVFTCDRMSLYGFMQWLKSRNN